MFSSFFCDDRLLLPFIILTPIFGIIRILFINKFDTNSIKETGLISSVIAFLLSLNLWYNFDKNCCEFQFNLNLKWVPSMNMEYIFGIDGISIFFILLTTLLFMLCFLIGFQSNNKLVKEYTAFFLGLESFLLIVFFGKRSFFILRFF